LIRVFIKTVFIKKILVIYHFVVLRISIIQKFLSHATKPWVWKMQNMLQTLF